MQAFAEEVIAAQEDFAENFWLPLYTRAAQSGRVAAKYIRPPKYDKSSLVDRFSWLKAVGAIFANGGLSQEAYQQEFGFDHDVIISQKRAEKSEIQEGLHLPGYEPSQGIVAEVNYGLLTKGETLMRQAKEKLPVNPGRPGKTGAKPTPESLGTRQPRPSANK